MSAVSASLRLLALAALAFAGCGDKAPKPAEGEATAAQTAEGSAAKAGEGAEKTADRHAADGREHAEAEKTGGDDHGHAHGSHGHDGHAHGDDHAHGHDHDHPAPLALKLDDGKKWQMDEHTRKALADLDARLAKGPASADAAGYKALGDDLDQSLQALVRGCTMTGPSHDQLHVWLSAFIPVVGQLKADGVDADTGEAKAAEATKLVAAAKDHFE